METEEDQHTRKVHFKPLTIKLGKMTLGYDDK